MLKAAVAVIALSFTSATALAQGVFVEPLPNVKPLPPAESGINGRVEGINAGVFDAIAEIRSKKLSTTNDSVAPFLRAALMKDGKIDAVEADLLNEMTQPRIRSINVTRKDAKPTDPVQVVVTAAGTAKKVYFDTLYPAGTLIGSYSIGEKEWKNLVVSARSNVERETQVTNFLAEKIGEAWKQSSTANAYKPTVTLITQLHNWSKAAEPDADAVMAGRILTYRAAYTADIKAENAIPDFLYNWLKQPPKPAG